VPTASHLTIQPLLEVSKERTSMHLGFFLLCRCKELRKKVTLRSEMNAVAMGRVPSVEQCKTIMVFLKDYALIIEIHRPFLTLTVTKTKYLAPASSKRSSHLLALNLEPVKSAKKSSYTTSCIMSAQIVTLN
jgi:hypothetical protein